MTHRYTSISRRARLLIGIFVAFAALIAVAAAKPTMAQNHRSTAQNHRSNPGKISDWQLTRASDRVNALGNSPSYRAAFGGVRVTASGRLIVYVVRGGSAPFRTAISALLARRAITVPYAVVTVRNSWAQLLAHQRSIERDWKQLERHGIPISEMWPDPATNKIRVTLRHSSSRAMTVLRNRYGVRWITVNRVARDVQALPMGRFDDTSPFVAGDGIWPNSSTPPSEGFKCTSGFAIAYTKRNGDHVNGFITAAHCMNAEGDAIWTNHDNPVKIGGVSFRQAPCDGSHTDTATFQGVAIGDAWGLNMQLYNVAGTVVASVGDDVAFDGARTGEVAKASVTKVNVDMEWNNTGCIMHGITIVHKANTTICERGDSGGPVLVHTNVTGKVNAAGQIVATELVNGVEDPTTCGYVTIARAMDPGNGTILKG